MLLSSACPTLRLCRGTWAASCDCLADRGSCFAVTLPTGAWYLLHPCVSGSVARGHGPASSPLPPVMQWASGGVPSRTPWASDSLLLRAPLRSCCVLRSISGWLLPVTRVSIPCLSPLSLVIMLLATLRGRRALLPWAADAGALGSGPAPASCASVVLAQWRSSPQCASSAEQSCSCSVAFGLGPATLPLLPVLR